MMTTDTLNVENWSCPLPLRDYPTIIMGHGGGGKLSAELVEHLFLPAFKNDTLSSLSCIVTRQSASLEGYAIAVKNGIKLVK